VSSGGGETSGGLECGIPGPEGVDEGVDDGVGDGLGDPLSPPPLLLGDGEPESEQDGVGVGVPGPASAGAWLPLAADVDADAPPDAASAAGETGSVLLLELGELALQLESAAAAAVPDAACAGMANIAPIATVPVATAPRTVVVERPVCLCRTTMRPPPCRAFPCSVRERSIDHGPGGHTGPP